MVTGSLDLSGRADSEELARRFSETRDPEVREQLILAYFPAVEKVLNRYCKSFMSRDDMRQWIYIGLIRAVDRYNPDKGVTFMFYAFAMMEGYAKKYISQSIEQSTEKAYGLFEVDRPIDCPPDKSVESVESLFSLWGKYIDDDVDRKMCYERYVKDRMLREIGADYGVTARRAHQRVTRALENIETALEAEGKTFYDYV